MKSAFVIAIASFLLPACMGGSDSASSNDARGVPFVVESSVVEENNQQVWQGVVELDGVRARVFVGHGSVSLQAGDQSLNMVRTDKLMTIELQRGESFYEGAAADSTMQRIIERQSVDGLLQAIRQEAAASQGVSTTLSRWNWLLPVVEHAVAQSEKALRTSPRPVFDGFVIKMAMEAGLADRAHDDTAEKYYCGPDNVCNNGCSCGYACGSCCDSDEIPLCGHDTQGYHYCYCHDPRDGAIPQF